MTDTPNLKLSYIAAAQAQKHVTHNEAIRALDAIVQLSVLDKDLATPPASPADGDRYIVASGATGAWAGKDGQIAAFQDGAWMVYAPREGWLAWVADEDKLYAYDGSSWSDATNAAHQNVPFLGINATADATNRLAVSSPASLFNHAGAGHQLKVNKNTAADTASVLFQTGFSGRAEFGLAGDDDWHVKVSADGTTWNEAFVVDGGTGETTLKKDLVLPDGVKLRNTGTASTSGVVIEGGGTFGQVALIVQNVNGANGAVFEQRSSDPAIDLVDLVLRTLSHQMNLRVESRSNKVQTGQAPEMRIGWQNNGFKDLFNLSPRAAKFQVPPIAPSYTVATLPSASTVGAGAMVYVSNESGGPVLAFSDGTNWRRVTDRAVVS